MLVANQSQVAFHNAPMPTLCPGLAVQPYDYQLKAQGMIEFARDSAFKGILIGDPPGLGKTIIAMMAMVKAIAQAKRFSVVVVPPSCVKQWYDEFGKFFVAVSNP